jgi:hypothetical protein
MYAVRILGCGSRSRALQCWLRGDKHACADIPARSGSHLKLRRCRHHFLTVFQRNSQCTLVTEVLAFQWTNPLLSTKIWECHCWMAPFISHLSSIPLHEISHLEPKYSSAPKGTFYGWLKFISTSPFRTYSPYAVCASRIYSRTSTGEKVQGTFCKEACIKSKCGPQRRGIGML